MFRKLKNSRAGRIALWSFLSFFSGALVAFASIPLAVRYLPPAEIGIWVVIHQVSIYLAWFDLGIGDGISRKIAPSIAAGDQDEASSWWSVGLVVLLAQGLLVVVIGIAAAPLVLNWLNLSHEERASSRQLLLALIVVVALNLPSRLYPGILLAQQRYQWVPMVQSGLPWIQIAVFWLLLAAGWGVFSFLGALAASQLTGFIAFLILVHGGGPDRLRFQLRPGSGLKVRGLLGFGGSMTLNGLVASLLSSLPTLMIGRWGGLAEVPVYGFTQRGPFVLSNLSLRAGVAFFPGMQRMFVEGRNREFAERYERVLGLVVATGMIGAGLVIGFNRALVETLAGGSYYAGAWTSAWLALGVLVAPFAASVMNLLNFSGSAGALALWALAQLILAALLGPWVFGFAGMAGLAAMVVLIPLGTTVPYALWRGGKACGLELKKPMLSLGRRLLLSAVGVVAGSALVSAWEQQGPLVEGFGRFWQLPSAMEVLAGSVLIVPGLFFAWKSVAPMLANRAVNAAGNV